MNVVDIKTDKLKTQESLKRIPAFNLFILLFLAQSNIYHIR